MNTLELTLRNAAQQYYENGTSPHTDDEYDEMVETLRKKDPNNSFLKEVGFSGAQDKIDLPIGLPSLSKLKTEEELNRWIAKMSKISLKSSKWVVNLFKDGKGIYDFPVPEVPTTGTYVTISGICKNDTEVDPNNNYIFTFPGLESLTFDPRTCVYVPNYKGIYRNSRDEPIKVAHAMETTPLLCISGRIYPLMYFYATPKLDGISLLKWNDKYFTRGNGMQGRDVTSIVKKMKLDTPSWSCRGELVSKTLSRNEIAGLLARKTEPDPTEFKGVEFIPFDIFNGCPYGNNISTLHKEHGPKIMVKPTHETLTKLFKEWQDVGYPIDGVCLYPNYRMTELLEPIWPIEPPKDVMAYKNFTHKTYETTVISVVWKVSKAGKFKPTVEFYPILDNSVCISRATGNNAKFIRDNGIGPGAKILVIRSGQVIPKIHEVLKKAEPQYPPEEFTWNGVDIIMSESALENSVGFKVSKLSAMFKACDIKNIGPKTLNTLVSAGYSNLHDIFSINAEDLVGISGLGAATVQHIKTALAKFKETPLISVVSGSGCFKGFSEKKLTTLHNSIPTIFKEAPSATEISDIPGFGKKTAQMFLNCYHEYKQFLQELETIYSIE